MQWWHELVAGAGKLQIGSRAAQRLKFASHLFAGLLDLASHDKLIQDQVHLQRYRSITERCDMQATGPQACCAVSIILLKKA